MKGGLLLNTIIDFAFISKIHNWVEILIKLFSQIFTSGCLKIVTISKTLKYSYIHRYTYISWTKTGFCSTRLTLLLSTIATSHKLPSLDSTMPSCKLPSAQSTYTEVPYNPQHLILCTQETPHSHYWNCYHYIAIANNKKKTFTWNQN